ncbi:MAG: hypothetical protein CMK06_06045 [Ponticaulis sp.]|nr:hypothetical protein [Ponticaulis sp.]
MCTDVRASWHEHEGAGSDYTWLKDQMRSAGLDRRRTQLQTEIGRLAAAPSLPKRISRSLQAQAFAATNVFLCGKRRTLAE